MSCIPNSVSIVAAYVEGLVVGCTISSLVSVDVESPKVLFVLKNDSSTLRALSSANIFSISVLAENQRSIALDFSSASKETSLDSWSVGDDGSLRLDNSLVSFSCKVVDLHVKGSTSIVIASVVSQRFSTTLKPLIYSFRAFGTFTDHKSEI